MLQQTTVATVVPRFERFVARWPTVEALAAASDEDDPRRMGGPWLLCPRPQPHRLRARSGRGAAAFPTTAAGLRELPGIGAYTSAAIAAIAFGETAAAVDTNVERVIARLNGARSSRRGARSSGCCSRMMPADRPGDFVQAMMDLGATICRPEGAALRRLPAARAIAPPSPAARPKPFRRRKPTRAAAASIRRRLVDRARRPGVAGAAARRRVCSAGWRRCPAANGTEAPPRCSAERSAPSATSSPISRSTLRSCGAPSPIGDGWWQPLDELDEAGLPTLYRRAAELALDAAERRPAAA